MRTVAELSPSDLYRACDASKLGFDTTSELEAPTEAPGQTRALAAVEFGIELEGAGYNVFAFGPPGMGKHGAIQRYLSARAKEQPKPDDCCYVNNFKEAQKPHLLRLPAGKGAELRSEMERLIAEVGTVLRAVFEGEEYQGRRRSITETAEQRQQEIIETLAKKAADSGIALLRTPVGIAFAPLSDGEIVSPEQFSELPEKEQERLRGEIERFEKKVGQALHQEPVVQRQVRDQIRELNRTVSRRAIGPLIADMREAFAGFAKVESYITEVENEILDHAHSFLARAQGDDAQQQLQRMLGGEPADEGFSQRFEVNLLVDHSESEGAPVVYEDHPSVQNLLGRIEHLSRMGTLVTDFTMIKAGALHRANGGYLLVDAIRLLREPLAWEALKRMLESRRVTIESLGQLTSLVSTYSLEPEPVPLSVKIVLIGPPIVYYLLSAHDPDCRRLFKVKADFGERMERDEAAEAAYARLVAGLAADHGLKPFDSTAVARIIEHGARLVGDAERLSLSVEAIEGLAREADHWAGKNGNGRVTAQDVQQALDAKEFRADRIRQRMLEETLRETILVDTEGSEVGQVNGLSVLTLGDYLFGRPSRITARVRLGKGEVLDIEREVEMSGPIHSKGVLILAGFLGSRYAAERPLSLSASLVFEQSYSGVDGDSASSAELYALLSAIGGFPLRQSLAVTGSVNQLGQVQAVGGVNEKIEGFFDLCEKRGLTGDQGVLIPSSNVKHLMLAGRVVDAVRDGKFHIYPVATIDQGLEVLTELASGEPDEEGTYPQDSINGKVQARLEVLTERARFYSSPPAEPIGEEKGEPVGSDSRKG
ncbi:MAG: AAA family ATPase [bacterium]|nr:AAA family ATPase [bacterium]